MPTLFRFILICGALAAAVYGVVFMLANAVKTEPREITVVVPPSKYAK
ncbi:MAG: histidine kinase [Beijerinckiaceae bacterium]